jgi:hypothetical protein
MSTDDLSDSVMRAFHAQWPADMGDCPAPSLLTEQTLTPQHVKVNLSPPWCNTRCQAYELNYILDIQFGCQLITAMVENVARMTTFMALKDQKCDVYFSTDEPRRHPPKPITSEERQRVFSDYCVTVEFTTNYCENSLNVTFCLYHLPRDKP